MSGTDTAGMVPGRFDVIIDGCGYILSNTVDQSLPFRVQRAKYSYTPTFVERANTGSAYGDDQQAFWLTASQNDWSLGEQQRYFRATDTTAKRKYWLATNIDVSVQGQATLRPGITTATAGAAVRGCCAGRKDGSGLSTVIAAAGTTNLYTVDNTGTFTSQGAHGLGAAPGKAGICSDGDAVYMATTAAGTVGVRKWSGAAYSTFSATAADALEFQNNTLYGVDTTLATLQSYSTAGVATTIYTWKDADGTARSSAGQPRVALKPFGGNLAILWSVGVGTTPGAELWLLTGASTVAIAAAFPSNFEAYEMEVLNGVLYISGVFYKPGTVNVNPKPAIYAYTASTFGLVWQANDYYGEVAAAFVGHPTLAVIDGGLVFTDDTTGKFMHYNPTTLAVTSLGSYTVAGDTPQMAACGRFFLHTRNQTTAYVFPSTTTATAGTLVSSLFDFESSLTKLMRGVIVEWAAATDGDGGSVDIAYQIGSLDGSYTNLRTGAVSGTEYTLSGVTGRNISVKVTINKGTSTSGPKLKRVYVRASPVLQQYRMCDYILDCAGYNGKTPVRLRNDTDQPLDGLAMANNLVTAATSTSPISITDRFGTFTGIIEPDKFELIELRPEEFIARLSVRQV